MGSQIPEYFKIAQIQDKLPGFRQEARFEIGLYNPVEIADEFQNLVQDFRYLRWNLKFKTPS